MSAYRESGNVACPRCGDGFVTPKNVAGIGVCPTCGGVFADIATSQKIVARLDRTILEVGFQAALGKERRPDDGRVLRCPHCSAPMQRTALAAAACVVDACAAHGTWFDPGELEDVMRAFARRGELDPTRLTRVRSTRDSNSWAQQDLNL